MGKKDYGYIDLCKKQVGSCVSPTKTQRDATVIYWNALGNNWVDYDLSTFICLTSS